MPTSSLMLSFLLRWNVSRSHNCAVSNEVVKAYLPEAWTEMLPMADSWPFIQATISFVSEMNFLRWFLDNQVGMPKIYITRKMTSLGINIVIPNINNYNFALFNLYVSMRENVPVSKHFSE